MPPNIFVIWGIRLTEILEFYPDTVSFVQKIKIPFASFITYIVFISTELTQKNPLENVKYLIKKLNCP